MLFHRSTEVAIQALIFLAQQAPGKLSPTHEIAAQAGVSEAYLAKILQRLTSAGLVRAFRGSGKGVELGRPAEELRLASIIDTVQGGLESDKCVLGLTICSEENPCPLHDEWLPQRAAIHQMVDGKSLADLVRICQHPPAVLPPVAPSQSTPDNLEPQGGESR